MYIKYLDLKEFIKSFDECEDDLELIKLSNFIDKYFDDEILVSIDSFDIFIPRDIVDKHIGYEEELYNTNIEELKDELIISKFRHLNPNNDKKIYNIYENPKKAKQLYTKIQNQKTLIDKNNKLLNSISELKNNYKTQKVLCFDFEAFEKNQSKITELGITTLIDNIYKSEHYIVRENLNYKNQKSINDRRFNFNFGQSKTLSLKEIMVILKKHLDKTDFVVGQSIDNDFGYINRYLKSQDELPKDFIEMKNYQIVDTHDLTFLYSNSGMGIKKALDLFKIPYRNLHNGGNDSRYNIMMFEYMINNFDDKKIKNEILDLTISLDRFEIEFKENYKIKKDFKVEKNVYRLDDTKKLLEVYFDTKNALLAKSDTIIYIKNDIDINSILLNGFFNSLLRKLFTSNSMYLQKIDSKSANGVVAFANTTYENIEMIDIDGSFYLSDGVFTLCDDTLGLQRVKQSFKKAFFGSTGGFFIEKLTGKGRAVISANGCIEKIVLKNEEMILDEAHLLAWEDTLSIEENKSNTMINNIKSGEFFSTKVTGSGTLYLSSEKINSSISSMLITILGAIVGIAYSVTELYSAFMG